MLGLSNPAARISTAQVVWFQQKRWHRVQKSGQAVGPKQLGKALKELDWQDMHCSLFSENEVIAIQGCMCTHLCMPSCAVVESCGLF